MAGRWLEKKFVSQYQKNCIVTAGTVGCWTVSRHRPRHGAGRSRHALGARLGEQGDEGRAGQAIAGEQGAQRVRR